VARTILHGRAFARVAPMRAKMFFYCCAAIAFFLCFRLYLVQVVQGPSLARQALAQRSDTVEVFARRGFIADRSGTMLVRSLPSESVYAVPHDIIDPDATAAKLQALFGKLDPSIVASLHDRSLWFVWIARKVPVEVADRIKQLDIPGVQLKEETTGKRIDMVGDMASTILGFVGTDENGLDGLEYQFDDLLKGQSGQVTLETDEFGRPIPFGKETVVKAAQPGTSLELTIDSYLQFVTEEALDQEVAKYHGRDGTAIVMDPWTGEILAMANVPHFDPNHFWKYPSADYRDRAVTDTYEPGSTFKLVTAAAALASGRVTLQSRFAAKDTLTIAGHTIHNADDDMPTTGSTESLAQIIEYSHNVGAAEVGMATGSQAFYDMERSAGFGAVTDVELPGESPDLIPAPADFSDLSLPTMSFGQGVSVTPLSMARYYCAIANGGLLMRPRIVRALENQDGKIVYQYPPEIEHRVFSEDIAAKLRSMLRLVVTGGTGKGVAEVPGYTTAGKTGTAQMVQNGVYESGAYAASFIGMIPADHPRYVIYVKIERPVGAYYGGLVAGPVFTKVAREAMLHAGIMPQMQAPKR
jgi:stage V sporulation protein D (sporulation-specific penicillin-binding protein)